MKSISVDTDPDVSWLENRNGMPPIISLQAYDFDERIGVMAVGRSGKVLRGGMTVNRQAFREFCEKFLSIDKVYKKEMIVLEDGSIHIMDGDKEIVSWVQKEWEEDPSIVLSIINAVLIVLTEGPDKLREVIGSN